MKQVDMNNLTYGEFHTLMYQHNCENGIKVKGEDKHPLIGVVVFSQDNWDKEYSLESRSYRVSSDNKAFIPGQIGRSIFADALDGSDDGVRLDYYPEWIVDHCYMLDAE